MANCIAAVLFLGSPLVYAKRSMKSVYELERIFVFPAALGIVGIFAFLPKTAPLDQRQMPQGEK